MKVKYLLTALSAFIIISTGLPSLSASIIAPGQSAAPDLFTTPASSSGYTLLASTGLQNVDPVAGSSFDASYTEYVYMDANNLSCPTCLDFLFSVSNAGPGIIERLSTANFDSFITDVGYNTSGITGGPSAVPAGLIPLTVDRSSSGGVIGFNFDAPSSPIVSGESSVLLEIQTNATNYMAGTISVQDGVAGFAAGFAPTTTPEPMSMVLIGSGLVAVGLLKRRVKSPLAVETTKVDSTHSR
jgi:hypothetical protein